MKHIPIIPYDLHLYVTSDAAEWSKMRIKNGMPPYDGSCEGQMYHDGGAKFYVGIFKKEDINVVVHEVTHVVMYIAAHIGLHEITNEQEPVCYLMGHLVQKTLEKLPELCVLKG